MKIQDLRIGQRVRNKETGFEMIIVSMGVTGIDMSNPYVYCDFEENEGDVLEFIPDELEIVDSLRPKRRGMAEVADSLKIA